MPHSYEPYPQWIVDMVGLRPWPGVFGLSACALTWEPRWHHRDNLKIGDTVKGDRFGKKLGVVQFIGKISVGVLYA